MELSGYFAVARRWWWTLLVAAWVAGLAGFYVASRIAPTYESEAKLLVGPINTDDQTLRASGQLVQTYSQLVTTNNVLDPTLRELGLTNEMTPEALAVNTRVIANDVTRVLAIQVQDGDPERAASLANQMADQMILLSKSGVDRPDGALSYVQEAVADPVPVAPQSSLIVLLSTAAGIIAAILLVLLIEYLSPSIRTRDELAHLSGAPVLGSVPAPAKAMPDPRDLVDDASSAATAYRVIAGRIVYGDPEEVIHSLTVVDTESETGSTVAAINLGRALARLGRRVVVIDGGTRGGLAALYGIDPSPGIRDVLARAVQPRAATRVVGERLTIVPAGDEGSDLVDPERAGAVVHELLASADLVITAAPPVHAGPGALSWARALDRTVLVARRDHARRDDVEAAAETLVQVGGNLIGAILAERRAPLAGLLGRGGASSTRTAVRPAPAPQPALATQMATPMATAMTSPMSTSMVRPMGADGAPPTTVPYQPSPPPTNPGAPPSLRPTIIRASAPAMYATPAAQPAPDVTEEPSTPPATAPSRSSTRRSTSTRSRSSGSTGSADDPTSNP